MTRAHDDTNKASVGRAGEIEQQAAEWVTRIDLRGTPEEWAALDAWLAASPRHRAAFLRLSVAWRRCDELKQLAPLSGVVDEDLLAREPAVLESLDDERAMPTAAVAQSAAEDQSGTRSAPARALRVVASTANPVPSDQGWAAARRYRAANGTVDGDEALPQQRSLWSRMRTSGTSSRLAASIAVFAVVGCGGLGAWYAVEGRGVDTYSTKIGEFRRVTLSDGSTVALNTDSAVRVRYSDTGRHVDLTRGEALFEVAKNPERPFDVKASTTTVRAVGTAFSVRLHEESRDKRVDVVVSEGRVAINPPSQRTYPAGSVATVRNGRVLATTVTLEDIPGKLAWTTGRLMFLDEKLGDIVAELNRYNERKLVITDPEIAGLRIGGTFQATDPDGFAKALDRTFGIKWHLTTKPLGNDVIRLESGVP